MKKAFQHSLSMTMAFLVLVSTVSFTVDKHFCGQMLMDMAIFSEAESCRMEMHSHTHEGTASIETETCCSNQFIAIQGQDELKNSLESLDFEKQLFLSSFAFSYLNLFVGLPEQKLPFKNYTPPLLVTDIQILDQVFLI